MSKFRFHLSVSADGYVAGPDQSEENPLGVGGLDLHRWVFELEAWRKQQGQEGGEVNASSQVVEEARSNVGATVMGRNMFGGGTGPWNEDQPWNGWWGDDPPFHTPVFVLTHHPRASLEMEGGTTFVFVTDGIGSALEVAEALELAEQVVEGLLANPQPGGQLGRPCTLWSGVLEDVQVRRVEVGEAAFVHPLEHAPLHRLPGDAQERADQRRPERLRRPRVHKVT